MPSTPRRYGTGREGLQWPSTPRLEELEESEGGMWLNCLPSLPVSTHGWYRVLVFSKDHWGVNRVLRRIRQKIKPLKLEPHYLHSGGEPDAAEDASALFTFYVNGYAVASALFRLCRVTNRLWLGVNNRMPIVQYNEAHREALKQAILSRYDPTRRSVNLTQFHQEAVLQGKFFALASPHCMSSVLWFLAREMPELEHLGLDRNHLSSLRPFWSVEDRLPRLKSISLENNDLNSLSWLEALRLLPLVELNLKRNLLPPGYEVEVLYMWPSLKKLNGVPVPPRMDLRLHCDRKYLIQKLSQVTGMNWVFSWKLLELNNCNYAQAIGSFQAMLHLGLISLQAFLRP